MSEWMLWSRFGGSIQLGSAPPPRLYLIPLSTSVENEGPLAISMGHRNRNERNLDGITRALDRAVSGEYDGVIFPSAILKFPDRNEVFARCKSRGLRVVHQITTDCLSTEHHSLMRFSLNRTEPNERLGDPFSRLDELMRRLDAGDALNLVFGGESLPKETLIARLTRWPDQVYFTYSVRKSDSTIELLHGLQPFVRERLFFHFPYHLEFGDGNLSCQQIYDLSERIHARVPGIRVRPMLGSENFDPRVDPDLELEPLHEPVFQTQAKSESSNQVLEISVIIPSYNNREYLLNTIKHLARQNLSSSKFEVIVVDDGSNDGSQQAVTALAQEYLGKLNFKYIYSPRLKPRKMGDANYRAGISRNLGVKNSSGRILCFLDSDILTPPNYLEDLLEKHRRFDVIQCKRLNLVNEKSDANIRFEDVNAEVDTFSTEDGYWEKFYALKDWGAEPFFWKYTCTYGLSVSAKLFKRVGWIRKGFVFYGFEDVELGYRLAQVGARFHLNETITYHLFHKNERSEFHNSDYLRQALLAKTAQIFYLGRLEPEIFFHFRGLMKEQLPLSSIVMYFAKKLGASDLYEGTRNWFSQKPTNSADTMALAKWIQIPFLAIWNWRWFIWRLLQKGKKNRFLKPPIEAFEQFLIRMRATTGSVSGSILSAIRIKERLQRGKDLFHRIPFWRIKRAAIIASSRLQIWRIRVFFEWISGQQWRLVVPLKRVSDKLQLWRLGIVTSKFGSQLWRIQVASVRALGAAKFMLAKIPFWKVRVLAEDLTRQAWRLKVPVQRALGFSRLLIARLQLWRIGAFISELTSQLWRVRVWGERMYGKSKAILFSIPFWKLRTMAWKALYPARKVYYVGLYQWEKRISKRVRSSANQQERP